MIPECSDKDGKNCHDFGDSKLPFCSDYNNEIKKLKSKYKSIASYVQSELNKLEGKPETQAEKNKKAAETAGNIAIAAELAR